MRPILRLVLALTCGLGGMLMWAPSADARDSTITITLTLRGPVAADVGFSFTTLPGVGGDAFCVSKAERKAALREGAGHYFPVCESGAIYTHTLTLAKGETFFGYEIGMYWPRRAHTLWSEALTWDGRNHHRSCVYDFGLPATDFGAEPAAGVASASGGSPGRQLALALTATLAWWFGWSVVGRRRLRAAAPG